MVFSVEELPLTDIVIPTIVVRMEATHHQSNFYELDIRETEAFSI